MSEQVNLESVKKVIKDEFKQQKNELTDTVCNRFAGEFKSFMENMELGQNNFQTETKAQIAKINKKVVGWGWVIVTSIITFIISVLVAFLILTWYHERYLSPVVQAREQHENELNDRGVTRSGHVIPKSIYEIRKDSIRDDSLRKIYR